MVPERKKIIALFFGVTFILTGLLFHACDSRPAKLVVGRQAPNFTYKNLNGEIRDLEDLQGKVIFLRFWADWCPVCTTEMPIIDKFYRDRKVDGLTVLAVNVKQTKAKVRAYIEKLNLSFPVALDPKGKISKQYNVKGLPWNFVINKEGILKDILAGEIVNEQMLQEFFEPYI